MQKPETAAPSYGKKTRLEDYYTDARNRLDSLQQFLAKPDPHARVINIYGTDFLGKSALLYMLKLHCQAREIHVALVDGHASSTPEDIVRSFAHELELDGLDLPSFSEAEELERKGNQTLHDMAGPVPGLIKSVNSLAGMVADTVIFFGDLFYGVFNKAEQERIRALIDGLHNKDAYKTLQTCLTKDMEKVSGGQYAGAPPLVLMLDHFEGVKDDELPLRDWVKELTNLDNVVFIVAGKYQLGPEWNAVLNVRAQELDKMCDEDAATLVRNYCRAEGLDEPSETQVNNVVSYAQGGPVAVIWAVNHCVEEHIPDWDILKSVWAKRQLLDWFKQGVDLKSVELNEAIQAGAIVGRFDKSILSDLVGAEKAERFYNGLKDIKWLISHQAAYLVIHDATCQTINEELKVSDPQKYTELHKRAYLSCERRLDMLVSGTQRAENTQTLLLENLYHRFQCSLNDPQAGVEARDYFKGVVEEQMGRRQFSFCASILEKVEVWDEADYCRDWVRYYRAMMDRYLLRNMDEALCTLEEMRSDLRLDDELKASVYECLAWAYGFGAQQACDARKAKDYLQRALEIREACASAAVAKARVLIWLGMLCQRMEGLGESYYGRAVEAVEGLAERSPLVKFIIAWARREQAISLLLRGDFEQASALFQKSHTTFKAMKLWQHDAITVMNYGRLLTLRGQLKNAEDMLKSSIDMFAEYGERNIEAWAHLSLGDIELRRQRYDAAAINYSHAQEMWQGDAFGNAVALGARAELQYARGEWRAATATVIKSLRSKLAQNDAYGAALGYGTLGNVLVAQKKYRMALRFLTTGRDCMRAYNSTYGQSLLALYTCHACYEADDAAAFETAAQECETLSKQHGYFDHLSRLLYDRAALCLKSLYAKEAAGDEAELTQIVETLQAALGYALRHNIFLLDALLADLSDILRQSEPSTTAEHKSLKESLLKLLEKRWRQQSWEGEQFKGRKLTAVELELRQQEDVGGTHQQTVIKQLRSAKTVEAVMQPTLEQARAATPAA